MLILSFFRVYVVGSKVLVRLFDTELSEKFLGSKHDLTLLEADARIISLYNPARHRQQELQKIGTWSMSILIVVHDTIFR